MTADTAAAEPVASYCFSSPGKCSGGREFLAVAHQMWSVSGSGRIESVEMSPGAAAAVMGGGCGCCGCRPWCSLSAAVLDRQSVGGYWRSTWIPGAAVAAARFEPPVCLALVRCRKTSGWLVAAVGGLVLER